MREPVKAGIAQARSKGIALGRPKSAAKKISEVNPLSQGKAHKIRDRKTPQHRPDLSSKAAGGCLNAPNNQMARLYRIVATPLLVPHQKG